MHMLTRLRDLIADAHEGMKGVTVYRSHSFEAAAAYAGDVGDEGSAAVVIYEIGTTPPVRTTASVQGAKPTMRGFLLGIVRVTSDEDAALGRLSELTVESERRIFADDSAIRRLASGDVIDGGSEVAVIAGSERAIVNHAYVECHVPMTEGVADRKA